MWTASAGRAALVLFDAAVGATALAVTQGRPLADRTAVVAGAIFETVGDAIGPLVSLARDPVMHFGEQQPAKSLSALARRGAQFRGEAMHDWSAWVNAAVPGLADAVLLRIDLTELVRRHVDLDALARGLDVDAIVSRLDLVTLTETLIAEIDLPGIIHESTGAVASDAVRGVRMQGISADEAVGSTLGRMLFGRRGHAAVVEPG